MSRKSKKKQVSVVGSMNIDYVSSVDALPAAGETVTAEDFDTFLGGKGANQAIAAHRQGSKVFLFASVGEDEPGKIYIESLSEEGLDTTYIHAAPSTTGAAFITVDSSGENTIVISGGANEFLSKEDISSGSEAISKSNALLIQFEVPQQAILEAASVANENNVPVIINPSPFNPTFPWLSVETDYLIVNEPEAAEILEFSADLFDSSPVRQRIHELRIEHLIITRGSNGTLVFPKTEDPFEVDTLAVLPIDTVGAGDAFAGCFAAWIAAGADLQDAIRAANCAGALTTLGGGAQDPIPDRDKVEQHIEQIPKQRTKLKTK